MVVVVAAFVGLLLRATAERRERLRIAHVVSQYVPASFARELLGQPGEALPSGQVTFLFTDVAGSTKLWDDAPLAMASAMRDHDEVIEHSITSNDGAVVRPLGEGDSRFGVFRDAECALRAAVAISVRLVSTDWPTPRPITVRMALHTDEGDVRAGDYHGSAVNRCARLRSIAAPGEILLTQAVIDGVEPTMLTDFGLIELGETRLKDVATPQHLYVVRPSPLDRTAR